LAAVLAFFGGFATLCEDDFLGSVLVDRKILIIDLSHAIYRAWFSVPDNMTAPDGRHTNAAHGSLQIIIRAIEELHPDVVVGCWDHGKPKARTELLPDYKAGRAPMDDHMREQFPIIHELLEALGVGQLDIKGEEADDLLGSLAVANTAMGDKTYLLSGDKDMLQLVNEDVKIIAPKKFGELRVYDEKLVEDEHGVPPSRYVDLMALRGDPSDGIRGVDGIGAKTAAKLIQEWGSLDNLIEHRHELPNNKVGNAIREQWEQALLSRQIATIRKDMPIDLKIEDHRWGTFNEQQVKEAFGKYNLNAVAAKLMKHCETCAVIPEEQERLF
jgi:DNA polymerase-1